MWPNLDKSIKPRSVAYDEWKLKCKVIKSRFMLWMCNEDYSQLPIRIRFCKLGPICLGQRGIDRPFPVGGARIPSFNLRIEKWLQGIEKWLQREAFVEGASQREEGEEITKRKSDEGKHCSTSAINSSTTRQLPYRLPVGFINWSHTESQ